MSPVTQVESTRGCMVCRRRSSQVESSECVPLGSVRERVKEWNGWMDQKKGPVRSGQCLAASAAVCAQLVTVNRLHWPRRIGHLSKPDFDFTQRGG